MSLLELAHNEQSLVGISKTILRAGPAPAVIRPPLRFVGLHVMSPFRLPAVHEQLHFVVPRELTRQMLEESLPTSRDDEEVSNQTLPLNLDGSPLPKGTGALSEGTGWGHPSR